MFFISSAIFGVFHLFTFTEAFSTCGIGQWVNTECINLSRCDEYFKKIQHLHSTNSIEHHKMMTGMMQHITCGFEGKVPKVCCPIKNQHSENSLSNHHLKTCGNFLWSKSLTPDGSPTDLGEFPWLALLEYKTPAGTKIGCGGVLISDRYVLTAAYCLSSNLHLSGVRLGEHDLNTKQDCVYSGSNPFDRYCSDSSILVGIEQKIPHENYSPFRGPKDFETHLNDIGLLRLDRSVTTTDYVQPICLPDDKVMREGKFLSAGWGAMPDNNYLASNVKRMARLSAINKEYCENRYRRTLHQDVMCALTKSSYTACLGDFGGPLMAVDGRSKMMVAGIFSPAGSGFCQSSGLPGTYIDVLKYADWINAHIRR